VTHSKEIFSAIAIALTFIGFLPYTVSILRGTVRPHVFSWIIWSVATMVVFFAQLDGKGGVGAWPTGLSGLVTILIAVLAHLKRGDTAITRWDWIFFVMALSSLPFWYYSEDPLWAVIILTVVDTLGFGPTIRRTYHHPHSESLMFYSLFTTRNLISIFALETYSVTTILFPAVVAATCLLFVVMAMIRRRSLAR